MNIKLYTPVLGVVMQDVYVCVHFFYILCVCVCPLAIIPFLRVMIIKSIVKIISPKRPTGTGISIFLVPETSYFFLFFFCRRNVLLTQESQYFWSPKRPIFLFFLSPKRPTDTGISIFLVAETSNFFFFVVAETSY